jgi:hypothetical protein
MSPTQTLSKATGTKCSKKSGEYCRLHNPAPSQQQFTSVNDVFKKVATTSEQRKTAIPSAVQRTPFQNITETRKLAQGIPLNLEEHAAQSDAKLTHLTADERKALRGYAGFAAGVCNNVLLGKDYEYYDEAPLWKESPAPCDFVNREELVDYMETMDTVLSPRQDKQQIVYRGTPIYKSLHDEIGTAIGKDLRVSDTEGLVEGLKEFYKPGKTFNYKTYLSTTHSAHYAAQRVSNIAGTKQNYYEKAEISGIVYEMKTNAGLDITGPGRSYEREVALPRDTHFKVTNVYVRPETYDTVSGYDKRGKPDEITEKAYKNVAVVVQMVEVDTEGKEITHKRPHKPTTRIEDIIAK